MYRGNPVTISIPMVPINNPITPEANPFNIDPADRLPIIVRPKIANIKYSGALNINEICANGGARNNNAKPLTNPPIIDEIVATPIAFDALPCFVN
ncbi:hypothetical protein GCM10007063_27060 [Lentibacillus kapialis]|uniref:Uncharacterized protein n=1 Tax=Lentibacillus kapialis TaxID=340214 RepID=A0A917V063_9BACI|nr:hypothetical protein GCM10007063_27060 [Lentibacillus kapialis]